MGSALVVVLRPDSENDMRRVVCYRSLWSLGIKSDGFERQKYRVLLLTSGMSNFTNKAGKRDVQDQAFKLLKVMYFAPNSYGSITSVYRCNISINIIDLEQNFSGYTTPSWSPSASMIKMYPHKRNTNWDIPTFIQCSITQYLLRKTTNSRL